MATNFKLKSSPKGEGFSPEGDINLDCFRLRRRNDGHAGDCFIFAFFAISVITPF
jgi:hypothetical protein